MRAEGIALDNGYAALHVGRSPRRWRQGTPLAEADRAHRGMVILHHPVLLEDDNDLEQIASALKKVRACRDRIRE
jgi:hypothetical protein